MVRLSCNPHILRGLALFSPLSDAQFGALLLQIERRSYAARTRIVHAGEGADGLYVIVSGRAKLTFVDHDGRELVAESMGPNDFFGEAGVIDGNPRVASVDAQDACEILFVPRSVLLECVEHNAAAAMAMLRTVVGRLDDAYRKMAVLAQQAGEQTLTAPPLAERH
jgi:CRP/FNR family transcriptional regulator, cyclic AMP receptor protein